MLNTKADVAAFLGSCITSSVITSIALHKLEDASFGLIALVLLGVFILSCGIGLLAAILVQAIDK